MIKLGYTKNLPKEPIESDESIIKTLKKKVFVLKDD